MEIAKHKEYVGLYTDYRKAIMNDFYGNNILVNCFEGDKKKTTILETFKGDLEFENKYFYKSIIPEIEGALENGFDKSIVSDKFLASVGCFDELLQKGEMMMESYDLTSKEITTLKKMLLHLNHDLN
jgi:hypothetical protein